MSTKKNHFKHTENPIAVDDPVMYGALLHLENTQLIPKNRAVLYKSDNDDNDYSFKTSLCINLENSQPTVFFFSDYKELWLIEYHNQKVQLRGSKKHCTPDSVDGCVISGIDILNKNALWISDLAYHLALLLDEKVCAAASFNTNPQLFLTTMPYYDLELDLLSTAIESFISELDANIIRVLYKEGTGNHSIYNQYVSANPEQQRNRIQAADSYPCFSLLLRTDYKLIDAVDSGKSLTTELATHYQVKPRTLKFFQNFIQHKFITGESLLGHSKISWMKSIDHFTSEYFPKNKADHDAFFSISEPLLTLAELLQVEPVKLAKPFRNGWQHGIEQLEKQLDHPLDFEAIFNMMQASFYYGVKTLLNGMQLNGTTHPPAKWYKVWFAQYGLKRLFKMANQWELEYGQFTCARLDIETNRDIKKKITNIKWPSLLSANYFHGSYSVVELTCQYDLEVEGENLEHCVASYGIQCLINGSHIYSIRDLLGNSLSTFEVKFNGNKAELLQHNAIGNSEPTDQQQACARYFVDSVLSTVSSKQRAMVEAKKHEIWNLMPDILYKPDIQIKLLTHTEKTTLQEMIAFTHPVDITTNNFYQYFNEKVLGIKKSETQKDCMKQIWALLS